MSTQTRTRQPKGVPVGGQFAAETRTEATGVTLTAPVEETVFTKRYDTLDEKVQAFHDELEEQVAALADDENWQHYLDTMSRFHRYSGGKVGVFDLRECRAPPCAVSSRVNPSTADRLPAPSGWPCDSQCVNRSRG